MGLRTDLSGTFLRPCRTAPMSMNSTKLLTVEDVAALLKVSRSWSTSTRGARRDASRAIAIYQDR